METNVFFKNRFQWLLCLGFSIALLAACGEQEKMSSNSRSTGKSIDLSIEEAYTFSISAPYGYYPLDSASKRIEWTPLESDIVKMEIKNLFTFDTVPIFNSNSQIARWDTVGVTIISSAKVIAMKKGEVIITAQIGNNPPEEWMVNVEGSSDDEGVTINGVTWATCNVNTPGFFAANPQRAGLYYQWDNRTGWSVTSAELTWNGSWSSNDSVWQEASNPCPEGWRIPTGTELESLLKTGSRWETRKDTIKSRNMIVDVNGLVFSEGENSIFMPAAGYLREQEIVDSNGEPIKEVVFFEGNLGGAYWGYSTRIDTIKNERLPYPYCFSFGNGSPQVSDNYPFIGFSCRCVKE